MTVEDNSTRFINKSEGVVLYRWGSLYMALPLCVLLPLAFIWPLLPDAWFMLDWAQSIDNWWRLHFHKLAAEGTAYDRMSPYWGTRYVILMAVCWSVIILTNVVLIFPAIFLTWKFGHRINGAQRSVFWAFPVVLALSGYAMFWPWLRLDEANPGHLSMVWGRTFLVYPLMTGLAAFFHIAVAGSVVVGTKVLKYRKR